MLVLGGFDGLGCVARGEGWEGGREEVCIPLEMRRSLRRPFWGVDDEMIRIVGGGRSLFGGGWHFGLKGAMGLMGWSGGMRNGLCDVGRWFGDRSSISFR